MMLNHVWGLFAHPQEEWLEIRSEARANRNRYLSHLLLLAAIPAICAYIGATKVGWQYVPGQTGLLTEQSAMAMACAAYLAMLGATFFIGFFVHWMAHTYGTTPSMRKCIIFAAYNATPMFVAGVLALYPSLMLTILGIAAAASYSVYLLYLGIPIMMGIPKERGFLFSTSVLAVGLVVLVSMLAGTVIVWGMGFGPVWQ